MWKSEVKGENPWASYTSNTHVYETSMNPDSAAAEWNTLMSGGGQENPYVKDKITDFVVNNSNDTVVYFNVNNTILKLETANRNFYKALRKQGKRSHEARIAMFAGIATGTIISVFSLPVNLLGSALPTPKTRKIIKQFKQDNPHATRKEINAFRMGISGKRFYNSVSGVAIGAGINLAILVSIGILLIF